LKHDVGASLLANMLINLDNIF